MHNLVRHRRTIHESCNICSCTQCDYTTLQKSNLKRHAKRHSKTPLTSNLPPKITCREPILNIIEPTENDQFLRDIKEQELRDMLSSQVGFGVIQITPADENIPHEIHQFFRDEQPWGTDRNLRQVYVQNFHRIRDSEIHNRRSRIFLRYLHHDRAPLIETITQALESIFHRQTNAFKIWLLKWCKIQHFKILFIFTIYSFTFNICLLT